MILICFVVFYLCNWANCIVFASGTDALIRFYFANYLGFWSWNLSDIFKKMPPKKDAGKAAPKKPKVKIFNIDSAEKLKASDKTKGCG